MAEHLARIIGTEEDRVNCPFYWKIGACRHGDQCSRTHYKPTCGQTLIIRHLYENPPIALAISEGQEVDDEAADHCQDHFENFYQEIFNELTKFGEIEELIVLDNIGDHMIGNAYVKYVNEEGAAQALSNLLGRYYAGRLVEPEYSPVTDFRESRCRQFVDGQCTRGGYCNFMHLKHVPRSMKRKLITAMIENHPNYTHHQQSGGSYTSHRGGGSYNRDYYGGDNQQYSVSRKRSYPQQQQSSSFERHRRYDRSNNYDRSTSYDNDRLERAERTDRIERAGSGDRIEESSKIPKRSASHERRAAIARWNEEGKDNN